MENMMGADLKERNAGFDSTLEVLKAEPIVPPIRKLDKESSAVYLPKREGLALRLPKYETIVPMKKLEATSSRADLAKPEAISPKREIKSKARKSRLGDRITALQELACPFGKTDTASVLFEAIAYIKFLQDQVEVLSACAPRNIQSTGRSEEHAYRSLRSRGLCLVPVEQVTHIKEHAYHNLGSRLCFLPTEQVAHIKADAPNHSPPPAKPISDSVVIDIRQDENLLNQLPDSKFLVPSSLKHAQVVQAAYEDNVVSRRGIITCFHAVALTLMLVILYLRSERVPQRPGFLGC